MSTVFRRRYRSGGSEANSRTAAARAGCPLKFSGGFNRLGVCELAREPDRVEQGGNAKARGSGLADEWVEPDSGADKELEPEDIESCDRVLRLRGGSGPLGRFGIRLRQWGMALPEYTTNTR